MPVLGRALRKTLTIVASERPRWPLTAGPKTAAGVRVSSAMAATAAAVYAATSLNAQTVATLPIDFLDATDDQRIPQQPPAVRALWTRPNPDQTLSAFIETLVMSLMLWGNFYGFIRRNEAGDVVEIWPIDPERVTEIERIDEDGQLGLRFRVEDFGWVTNRPGKPIEMLHIPWIALPGRIRGMSPVEFNAELIGMSLSSQEHAARFLGDGAHMSGQIETAAELNREDAKELLDNFNLGHAGPGKAGRVGVLSGGAKFTTITIPPNELQFLEQMQFTDRKITSIYRAPPHMVGDLEKSTSFGTGLEEIVKGYAVFTIVAIAKKIEDAVESTLLAGTQIQMRFQVNGLLRGSVKDRAEFYRVMQGLGWMSANEGRALEDMPPVPGPHGNRYYVPLNTVDAEAPREDIESRFRGAAAAGLLTSVGAEPVATGGPS